MSQAHSFGPTRAIPIVTYGVATRAEQRAGTAKKSRYSRLAFDISGALPSAAALTLGVLAISVSGDLPSQNAPAQADDFRSVPDRKENASVRVAIRSVADASDKESAMIPIAAEPRVEALSRSPPTFDAPPKEANTSEREAFGPSAEKPRRHEFAAVFPNEIPEGPGLDYLEKEDLLGEQMTAAAVSLDAPVRTLTPPPRSAEQPREDLIERDYSRTLRVAGASRDTPIASIAQVADPASERAEPASGRLDPGSVHVLDGELASVKLSEVLKIVESEMAPEKFAALAGSPAAQSYIGPETLGAAGLKGTFDPDTFVLALETVT